MSDKEEDDFDDTQEDEQEDENVDQPSGDEVEAEENEVGDEDDDKEEEEEEKEEKEQGEEEEEEEKDPEKILNSEQIAEGISLLCKTGDGLAHAFVKFEVTGKELTDISMLSSYIHLRYIDLSKNNLRDISPLNSLAHLLTLKVENNKLPSAQLDELPYLQMISFKQNHIKSLQGISHPLLEHLNLSFNEIQFLRGLEPEKLTRLHTLELRGNKLESTAGINLPNLKNLFLAENQIVRLEDLDRLESLATFHLRDCALETLDGFSDKLKSLQYINFRSNKIANLAEVTKLQVLPALRAVVFLECPISEEGEYRSEVLIALRRLERLDKDEYTEDERLDAEGTYQQRLEEAQAQLEETRERDGELPIGNEGEEEEEED